MSKAAKERHIKVIVAEGRKGGIGKTTTCINLATSLSRAGYNVGIYDVDSQGTLAKWFNNRVSKKGIKDDPYYIPLDQDNLADGVDKADKAGFDFLIIDTPPVEAKYLTHVTAIADLVIITTKPSGGDLDAVTDTVRAVRAAGKPFAFHISETRTNSVALIDTMKSLSSFGPIAGNTRTLDVFRELFTYGDTLFEAAPNSKATLDINSMRIFVENFFNGDN